MSGMAITETSLLEIIKTCGENHVESLELGELKLKFYNNNHHNQNQIIGFSQEEMSRSVIDMDVEDGTNELANDSQAIDEELLAQLSIEDPLAYEELSLKRLADLGSTV